MKTPALLLAITALAFAPDSPAQNPKSKAPPIKLTTATLQTAEHLYKKAPEGELKLYFHFPADWKATDKRPAIVFFFGGGWKNGTPLQFLPQAEYFASRGLVTARAEYRIRSIHKTTPDKCVEDAKSAMRWVRSHASELGVDSDKIIASGGSAGGHLAAATAFLDRFNDKSDDINVSCVPKALVLFNPALKLSEIGMPIEDASGTDIGKEISPTLFVKKGAPPAVMFFGTADRLAVQGHEFLAKGKETGNRVELYTAEGQPHGFFNRQPWIEPTTAQADRFLVSLGLLEGEPTIKLTDPKAVLQLAK